MERGPAFTQGLGREGALKTMRECNSNDRDTGRYPSSCDVKYFTRLVAPTCATLGGGVRKVHFPGRWLAEYPSRPYSSMAIVYALFTLNYICYSRECTVI